MSYRRYGIEAVQRYGAGQGGVLLIWRLIRCSPLVTCREALTQRGYEVLRVGQGSLKDTFCPFETWLFPPKYRETTCYKAMIRCIM